MCRWYVVEIIDRWLISITDSKASGVVKEGIQGAVIEVPVGG
jgi:hypothetical protein